MTNASHQTQDRPSGEKRWWDSGVSQVFSINELEELTGIDFFPEIPKEIQEVIEDYTNFQNIFPTGLPTSRLMAAPELGLESSIVEEDWTSLKYPIGQGGFPQNSITSLDLIHLRDTSAEFQLGQVDLSQIGSIKDGIGDIDFTHDRSSQIGISQIDFSQTNSPPLSSPQGRSSQINPEHIDIFENSIGQISTDQLSSSQVDFTKLHHSKISATQINTAEVLPNQTIGEGFTEANTSEISFSSLITFQQLFRSHQHTLNLQNTLISSSAAYYPTHWGSDSNVGCVVPKGNAPFQQKQNHKLN